MQQGSKIKNIHLGYSIGYERRAYVSACTLNVTRSEPRNILSYLGDSKVEKYYITEWWQFNDYIDNRYVNIKYK